MNYELAKELKEAGFPQRPYHRQTVVYRGPTDTEGRLAALIDAFSNADEWVVSPTLEELVEACGSAICGLSAPNGINSHWHAFDRNLHNYGNGANPTEAVARLWLVLNKPNTTSEASSK